MGNWITVNMKGKVNKEEAREMVEWLKFSRETFSSIAEEQLGVYYLQIITSVCGINNWVGADGNINVTGNVFERDCETEDLFNEVKALCNKFKTLELTIHVGGDYESTKCVATIVGNNERVEKLPPQIEELGEISSDNIRENFLQALGVIL